MNQLPEIPPHKNSNEKCPTLLKRPPHHRIYFFALHLELLKFQLIESPSECPTLYLMASTKKYLFNLNFLGNQHSDILLDPLPSNLKKILDLPKMLPTLKKLEILVSSFVPSIQFCLIPQLRKNSRLTKRPPILKK